MSDLNIGGLAADMKLNLDQLETDVRKAIGGLDKIEKKADSTEKKTEEVGKTLQKALKGEVLVNATNRVAGAVGALGDEFKGLQEVVTGAGAVMQGLFQGNLLGAAIAGAGVGVAHVVKLWSEAEKSAKAVAESFARDLAAQTKALDDVIARLRSVNEEATSIRAATANVTTSIATGLSPGAVGTFAGLDSAESLVEFRRGRVAALQSGMARETRPGQRELLAGDLRIAVAQLQEAEAALSRVNAALDYQIAIDRQAGEERLRQAKEERRLAMQAAVTEARNWRPEGLRTPGELDRMARADELVGTEGLSAKEARDRARRNAGYAANAAETLVIDKPLRRITETFADAADYVSSGVLDSVRTFADDLSDALSTAADVAGAAVQGAWQSLSPKSFGIGASLATGDAAGALAQAASLSKEFQHLGNALDTGLVEIVNALTEALRPAVPVLTMAIRAVVEVAKFIGDLVGLAMQITGVNSAFAMLFEGVKFLTAVLAGGAAATQWALNALQNAFREGAIKLLSLAGDMFKSQIDDLRAGIVQQGDLGATVAKAFDDVMKIGFNAELAAVGLGDAAAAADKVAQSFLNLPAGFKTAGAIYAAASGSSEAFGGYAPPAAAVPLPALAAGAPSSGSATGGDIFNFYGPISVSGDDSFRNVVTVSARQNGMAGGGTSRPVYRSSPTPHAPNSTQPYTPAAP